MDNPGLTLQLTATSGVITQIERIELGEPEQSAPATTPQPPSRVPHRTEEQGHALPAAVDQVRGWRRHQGFRGAAVLASRDHNRISVYSQFDSGSGTAPGVLESVRALGIQAGTLDRRPYDLMWRAGAETPTVISLRHSPVLHFGLFTVLDDQSDALLDRVEASAPASLVTPGLRTVNFHRSHDRQRLINVGTWSSFEDFHVLLDQPGFAAGQKYWEGLATFENDYFDLIEVVSGLG
jgi:hypothetical protein